MAYLINGLRSLKSSFKRLEFEKINEKLARDLSNIDSDSD
jgi:hypothetical protein